MATWTDKIRLLFDVDTKGAKGAFKDVEDAGKEFASGLHKAADKVDADLKDIGKISERLAKELGSDFRTIAGDGVQELAIRIHSAGITLDNFEGNVDGIVSGLRRFEDQADDAAKATRGIGDEADRSRGVMANFVGNAVQEIPGLSGAFGPLNTAIGQFAEYATEGGISLGGLAKTVGPMAAVGGAVAGVSLLINKLGEANRKAAEQARKVESAYDAWRQGNINKTVEELYGVTKALFDDIPDGVISYDKLAAAVAGNASAYEEVMNVMTTMRDMERPTDQQRYREEVNWQNRIDLLQSTRDTWAKTATEAQRYDYITGLIADRLPVFSGKIEDHNKIIKEQVTYLEEVNNQWDEYWRSLDNERMAADTWASFKDSNIALEDRLRLIGQYVQEVLGMPPEAMERFRLELSEGDLKAAQRYLEILQDIADAGYSGWRSPSRAGGSYIPVQKNARGTMSAMPGLSLVGEEGPELIALAGGERIFPAGQTASMLNGAGTTVNVTVNVPPTANPVETGRAVADALAAFYRNGGQRP